LVKLRPDGVLLALALEVEHLHPGLAVALVDDGELVGHVDF
jgi:hypothetical protein